MWGRGREGADVMYFDYVFIDFFFYNKSTKMCFLSFIHRLTISYEIFHTPCVSYAHYIGNTWSHIICHLHALRWRLNERDGASNHQPRDCLLDRLFRRRSKKTSKLCVTGRCTGNSPVAGEFHAQMTSIAENIFTFDDVIMGWEHVSRKEGTMIDMLLFRDGLYWFRHSTFPTQRPVTPSFDVFFYMRPTKWLSKQSWGRLAIWDAIAPIMTSLLYSTQIQYTPDISVLVCAICLCNEWCTRQFTSV